LLSINHLRHADTKANFASFRSRINGSLIANGMPQKRKRQGARQSSPTAKKKSKSRATLSDRSAKRNPSARSLSTRSSLIHVASDMRRDSNLTFTQGCHNRGVSPRSRHKHVTALFYKDALGRVRPLKSDPYSEKMSIPSARPDVLIDLVARGNKERQLVGEWFAAIKEAGRGDFTRLNRFPKRTYIDGVRLPTGAYEVQKILEALAGCGKIG
jgi:hypothetical protein